MNVKEWMYDAFSRFKSNIKNKSELIYYYLTKDFIDSALLCLRKPRSYLRIQCNNTGEKWSRSTGKETVYIVPFCDGLRLSQVPFKIKLSGCNDETCLFRWRKASASLQFAILKWKVMQANILITWTTIESQKSTSIFHLWRCQ